MKRFVSVVLIGLMLSASIFVGLFYANSSDEANLYDYTVNEYDPDIVTITKYNGSADVIVVPAEFDGKRVTIIGEGAFAGNENLVSVTLPSYLDTIHYSAFENCTNLADIKIPNGVRFISARAFYNCENLADFEIPGALKLIDDEAFYGCTSLTNIALPYTEEINNRAFYGCTGLEEISMRNSMAYIGDEAFGECPGITIVGDKGFYAHSYAVHYSIPFKDFELGEVSSDDAPDWIDTIPVPESDDVELFAVTGAKKIALDAGHGYDTAGKRTPKDYREWAMNSSVCNQIASLLADYDVEIIRTDDITGVVDVAYSTLAERYNRINSYNPDVSISIHHNAVMDNAWGSWGGVEVYYSVQTSKPNASQSQRDRDEHFATLMTDEMAKITGLYRKPLGSTNLAMTRQINGTIPAILVEGGFMDSISDEPMITSSVGQRAYAQAVANICISYLGLEKIK